MASTTKAIKKGEYVLINQELVDNGTFDTDVSGWSTYKTSAISSVSGVATVNAIGVADDQFITPIIVTTGVTYTVKFTKISGSNVRFVIGNSSSDYSGQQYLGTDNLPNGDYYFIFTANVTGTVYIKIKINNSIGEFDNISVKRVSDVFRAKQDAPVGTALTDTLYFEDRTQLGVTNQALMAHKYNTSTNSYEGLHTEVLFNDVAKEQLLDNSIWMANNGFSKVSQFLYSKGDSLYLPVGVVQC